MITGENVARFADHVGFADTVKRARLARLLGSYKRTLNRERFVATVDSVRADGFEDVYDVQIPGINEFDANGFHAHNCGEQPLPPYGSCLLGSVNLTRFVKNAFTDFAEFDWNEYREVVKVFTRMLDNVCEINGLPLEQQRDEIMRKRRHGMGFLGLGSTITCLGMKYGAEDSIKFTEDVSREMAVAGWEAALDLAKEKGPAPIMKEEFTVTAEMLRKRPEMAKDGWKIGDLIPGRILHARYSKYMQRVAETAPWLVDQLANVGARFTHHSSIAPTGTISLSLANNASQRHRALVRAPLFPQRHPPRQEEQGESGCLLIRASRLSRAHQSACDAELNEPGRTAAGLFHHGGRHHAAESTSTSRPRRRGGSTAPSPRPRTCLRITNTRASKTSICTPTRRI